MTDSLPPFRHAILAALLALLPAPASALEPVRVVATGGRIGYTFYAPPAGSTAFRQRTPHKLGGPVAEMQVGFMDWMYPTSTAETPNTTNDVTIEFAWLERAATGQTVPLTFGGNRTLVLPMNSTVPYWLSDPLPSSSWTGAPPARDEVFWLHVKGTIPEGGKNPVGTPANFTGAKSIFYPPASDPGTHDTAGAVPAISGSTSRTEGLPVVFLGRYTGPGHLAVIGIGDSILHGSGDNTTAKITGYGFFNRAALDANDSDTIATFNLTRHGQTAASWVNPSRQTRQKHFLPFANVVVEEYGTNDLGQDGTGNPTDILTRTESIWTAARNAGVRKIVRTLLMPRTDDSTGLWANAANQTPRPGWAVGGKRDTINAGLVAARDTGKIDVLLDTLAVMADPAASDRWLTNGTTKYTTSDGTHISASGNALLATHLRSALLSLAVDTDRADYAAWSSAIGWNGADSSPSADSDGDGITNLLAYALDLSPLGNIPAGSLPSIATDTITAGGPWISYVFRLNATAMDLQVTVESSADLIGWTAVTPDGSDITLETISADPDGDGSAVLRRIRMKQDNGHRFFRLKIRH